MRSFPWSGSYMSITRPKVAWDQTIKAPGNCSWAWGKILKLRSLAWPKMKHIIGDGMTTSIWFDNWHPHSPLADTYGERFIYDSGMEHNMRVNVLINNLEWRIPITQAIGQHPIIEAIPSTSTLNISTPKGCSLGLRNNEDHNHLFFECSYTKALWWNVCDRCDIPRMIKSLDEWIRWATITWHGKSFVNFSHKLGFTATVYYIWQERNVRIFAGVSKTSNLVFDQIECIIRDKLVLMRNIQQTDESIRIKRLWRVNNMDS
ncbi:zinc-binding domain-containing protein [Populus alba x Populus x berolinensis]|nr:zinc-binding domain-containing protein [Populus alba x Populus x berolinensis]